MGGDDRYKAYTFLSDQEFPALQLPAKTSSLLSLLHLSHLFDPFCLSLLPFPNRRAFPSDRECKSELNAFAVSSENTTCLERDPPS